MNIASLVPNSSDEASSAGAFSMLLLLVAIVLWTSHSIGHRLSFLTEGSLALLCGLFAGGGLFLYFERQGTHIPAELAAFNYDIYMSLLLPPIIFYAGFSIKKKHFFSNIGTLSALGVAGTILLAVVLSVLSSTALHRTGLDTHNVVGNSLALGVIFASTDSVAALQAIDGAAFPQLHALVFGEAVVNDATAIVLLKALQNIQTQAQLTWTALGHILQSFIQLSILSMILGVTVGLVCAFILKHSFGTRHSTDHEVSLLAALGFLSYLSAEWCNLSGVFSTFFCGVTMSHYAWHSLSPSAKVASVHAFRVLSFLAELCMFLSCGLDLWGDELWHTDTLTKKRSIKKIAGLVTWISIIVPLARFFVTLPLITVVNTLRKPGQSISWENRLAVSWAGCSRGAVTLALAVNHFLGSGAVDKHKEVKENEENKIIAAASMMAIVLSTVILGGATPAIFKRLLGDPSSKPATGATTYTNGRDEHRNLRQQFRSPALVAPLLEASAAPIITDSESVLPPARRRVFLPQNITNPREESDDEEDGDLIGPSLHAKWTTLDKTVFQPLFGGRSMSFKIDEVDEGGGEGGEPYRPEEREDTDIFEFNPNEGGVLPSPFENNKLRRDGERRRASDVEVGATSRPPSSRRLSTPGFGRVDTGVLEELFTQPGRSHRGPQVDREVEEDGLVQQAENCFG